MDKLKFRVNIIDVIAVLAIVLFAMVIALSWNNKPYLGSKNVSVEVMVTARNTINAVLPKMESAETVFYSGSKYPVKQVSYRTENDVYGQIKYLYITVEGLGDISSGKSIFNGQRIYINQKVELRGDYQVQGYVTDYHYED